MLKTIFRLKMPILFILFTVVIFTFVAELQATDENAWGGDKVKGIWKFDGARTLELRIEKGVPFHIGDRRGMGGGGRVLRQFNNGSFKFYDEKTCKLIDKGNYEIVRSNKKEKEIVLRIFPEDDFENANKYKFNELIRFTQLAGYNIPYIIGFRFIDGKTAQSFSYVRGFSNNMVKKDDNAYWNRISELPKCKRKRKEKGRILNIEESEGS